MQQISNSIRQRLSARPEPQDHPDPDVLTAFLEQLLPAAERSQVMLHLAGCRYCRDVMALSLPEVSSAPQVQPQAVPARSRRWIPAFRWAAALAVLTVAATLLLQKPWKQAPNRAFHSVEQAAAPKTAQPTQPSNTEPNTAAPAAPAATDNAPFVASTSRTQTPGILHGAPARPNSAGSEPRTVAVPQASLGALAETTMIASTLPPPRVAMAPMMRATDGAASNAVYQGAPSQDWVNTNALKAESAATANGFLAADTNGLPPAPAPQDRSEQASASNTKSFPAIPLGDLGARSFAGNLVPPTTATAPTGPTDGMTLRSSKGVFKIPRRVGSAVIQELEKAGGGQAAGFTDFAMTPRSTRLADNTEGNKAQGSPQLHWRINGDGILMKSTDYTRWHEAYPQSSDLQFKVVVTKGDQVWAGGNNATIIHSWNGGVQWETLKVPDSADVTAITVDDGWEVKTSDGQTFVSQDHGKTWVPLQAPK